VRIHLSGPSRYAVLVAAACGLIAFATRNSGAATASGVEQRIDRICNDIPPAVVIEGEPTRNSTLTALMTKFHVPGVSIAVIHDGKLEWARGFGVRDAADDPVTANTLFQAASISKPITALAALRMVDSGKLNLDANVNHYLRSWKIPNNGFTAKQKVTLRELLSHTAGMTVAGFSGYRAGTPLPSLVQILNGTSPANNAPIRVDTVPGTKWRYSGGGYVIVRQLLEDVSGEPFDELLQKSVFGPSGMAQSTFQQPLGPRFRANVAVPYDLNGHPVSTGAAIYPELAPDGLWTTPSDLARYAIQVQRALAGAPRALISRRTARLMLTPVLNHYGLGVIVGDDPDHPWFTHNGGNYGFICVFVAYLKGDGAVIMSDGDSGEFEIDLLRSIAQEYRWPDFEPFRVRPVALSIKVLDRYVGAYRMSANRFAVVTLNGNRLLLQTSSLPRQVMYPMSTQEFVAEHGVSDYYFFRADERKIAFVLDARGEAVGLTLSQSGSRAPSAASRMSGAGAAAVIQEMAAIDRRFELQRPAAGGEAALRVLLQELAKGATRYSGATPEFAEYLKSIVTTNEHFFAPLGRVVSIKFRSVNAVGVDTYHVVFRNGQGDMRLLLNSVGKVQHAQYFPE
jgi:CubicO group peptidase (beta-lactamase class C family)